MRFIQLKTSEEILDYFEDHLEAAGASENTIKLYLTQVGIAMNHNAFDNIANFNKFINFRRKNLAENSFNSQLDGLNAFAKYFKYIDDCGIDSKVIERIKEIKRYSNPIQVQERRAYTDEELDKLMNVEMTPWRYHFIFIGLNFGLRAGEIRNLKFSDIDLQINYLQVRAKTTKSKKNRMIPISQNIRSAIKTWVNLRENSQTYYVETKKHKVISKRSASYWKAIDKLVNFHVTAHNLRYTFATKLWLQSRNILLVQKYLGHSSPEITWNYLKIKRDDLDQEFTKLNFQVV